MLKRHDPTAHELLTRVFEPNTNELVPMKWASSQQVYADEQLLDAFLEHVLGVSFALVTDRTYISDFVGDPDAETIEDIRQKILTHFGVDVGADYSWSLYELLSHIKQLQQQAPPNHSI